MWSLSLLCTLSLGLPQVPGSGGASPAPRLDVLSGTARVLAGETWVTLGPGGVLPGPRAETTLSLDSDARACLTSPGASVELRGPLEIHSDFKDEWTVRLAGRGGAHISARSSALQVELASTTRLDLRRGAYWVDSLPSGGWRVGCDAGDTVLLRPPSGASWSSAPRLESGASLRLISAAGTHVAAPPAGRRLVAPPWKQFSWPWS